MKLVNTDVDIWEKASSELLNDIPENVWVSTRKTIIYSVQDVADYINDEITQRLQ